MKKIIVLLVGTLILSACGSGKKVISTSEISTTETTVEKTEEVKEVVQDSVITETISEEIDTTTETTEENPDVVTETVETPIETEVFNHSVWGMLLEENVTADGIVDYEGFRQNKGQLRDYIASLGAQMPAENWTQEDLLAYWMNAYNAMTVDLILRNLPLSSIKDIDNPWNQRLWKLGEKWYNLDEIEHQILRKMNDPRIHFGINCASFSCPPLLNEAFSSKTVDDQLEKLAKQFVNDPKRNTLSEDRIQVSKIFSWFAKDFKKDGSLIDFLNKYSNTPINSKARKSFKDYDWALNN